MPHSISISNRLSRGRTRTGTFQLFAACALVFGCVGSSGAADDGYRKQVEPVLEAYCIDCHSGAGAKGKVNFAADGLKDDSELWLKALRMVRAGMMPPKGKPRPTAEQVGAVETWVKTTAF